MPSYSETDLILNPDGSVYHLNLRPEDISDKIITVGDPSRVHRISRHFDNVDFEMNRREFITHTGMYKGKRITVISSGMGTDNVEILMNELDILANVDLKTREPKAKKKRLTIVRVGTSASIQEDLRLGSHVISEYAIGLDTLAQYYLLEMDDLENEISQKLQKELELTYLPYCVKGSEELIDRFKDGMTLGNTVTCPGFYAPQGRAIRLPIRYPRLIEQLNYFHVKGVWLTNLEMETAGYYMLANLLGHNMVSLNAIIANRLRNKFSKDPNQVIDSLIQKVLEKI